MELESASALILDVVDLGEYDRIVTFLTGRHGKKRGVVRGARRKHSRFGGQVQPLSRARLNWMEHPGRELVRISSVEMERSAKELQKDLDGILLGSYLADHVIQFAQENEDSQHLFRLLDSTLEALLKGIDHRVAARYFEAWVLRLAGVFPAPWHCPECGNEFRESGAVLPGEGEGLICGDCGAGRDSTRVSSDVVDFLRRIGRSNLVTVAAEPPSVHVLERVEWLCAQVRRRFLQCELKSYRVIREAGADF